MHNEGHHPWSAYTVPPREQMLDAPAALERQPDFARSFSQGLQLGQVNCPVLLMNLPLSLSASVPNNAWMEDMNACERGIRLDRAVAQFQSLYKHITRQAIVYVLPSQFGLQDQTYVSNLGVVLPHCENDTVIVSRFRTKPRVGESRIGASFFKLMNFAVEQPPRRFGPEPLYLEGEADLKHVRDNLYIGAYGIRTSRNALHWAGERFGMRIVPFRIVDPYLYHLDCCIFRLSPEAVMLCTSAADPDSLREIERHCEVIDISPEDARSGITNGLLLPDDILCDSNIVELRRDDPKYDVEKGKIDRLQKIAGRFSRNLSIFCMSEFYKSGALLSCLVMHIKYARNTS